MDDVRTVELGQFTDDNADAVAERLDRAGMVWYAKSSGRFGRLLFAGDWGVRLFVDQDRLQEARQLAAEVTGA